MTNNIIGFIGAGNMASALISGLINSGHNPRDLMASSPEEDHLDSMKQSFNIAVTKKNGEIFNKCNTIIFAVKPNILEGVLQKYSNQISFTNHLLISIAAGVLIKKIELSLNKNQRIIRAMPNTPASIKSAVTALCKNTNANKDDKALAENIFSSVGTTCWLDENSMDLYTALIGSGPAYIFYIIESLLATSAELLTTVLILLSKYFCNPTLNKTREKIAIIIEGNRVVVEKKSIYLRLVSEPNFPFFLSLKILYVL